MAAKLNGNARMASIIVAVVIATVTVTQALSGDTVMTRSNEHRLDEQEKVTAVIMEKLDGISSDIKEVKRDVRRSNRYNPTPPQ